MKQWSSKKIVEEAKKDFEKAWEKTADLTLVKAKRKRIFQRKKARPNLIYETTYELRKAYLDMGFEEIINPLFIEDTDVRKQFGPEAVAVLDRCYYLGGLPRPDIGISDKTLQEIEGFNVEADKDSLQNVLRLYKTGELSGDDLVGELARNLKTDDGTALKVLELIFPGIRSLKPLPSNITLRSHMTSGWFLTLEALYEKRDLPLMYFSIDRCFRREQREDSGHLRTYHSASCVILDDEVALMDGEEIVKGLLKGFGFKDFRFSPDEKRSKYYAPGTQTEVFGLSPTEEWVEIATFGMYSPIALSRYGIEHPVLNLGLGVERLAQVLSGSKDIRELTYPQFYTGLTLTDLEIAKGINLAKVPASEAGKEIAEKIIQTASKRALEKSPCRFEVWKGPVLGKKAAVSLVEVEEGTKLLGPAALNNVLVYNGNIFGVSRNKGPKEVLEKGTSTDITYIKGIANLAAWEIERAAKKGKKKLAVKVKGVKLPSDINLEVSDLVVRFVNSNNKNIDIRGPVFTTVEAELS
jgi:O-phosphoseryl-tRNA synthetase